MTLTLKDPTKRELRAAFENFGDHESILVSRWCHQSGLHAWAKRYGWTASVKAEGNFWRVTRTGTAPGRVVSDFARLRQRLDMVKVDGSLDCPGFTRDQVLEAAESLKDKRFRLHDVEGGGFIVLRLEDPDQ